MTLLRVENIGKAYRSYHSEWLRFASWFGLRIKPIEEHWILKNINFDVHPGEAIGIIGQNGAGKSTLLKMIAGTLMPSQGQIEVNGRISAILELGMGFNPELTGRQNVSHTAGLMGFSAEEILQVMQDIIAFAEVGEYFDQPVRTYSSGMQMRVAFSVATARRPEILIVDEALSVGDAYFQHKSFSRIREFQSQGTTLMIVSHDRSAIQSLCGRAILLGKGGVIKDASPEEAFDLYNAIIAEKENNTIKFTRFDNDRVQTFSGTGEARVKDVVIYNSNGDLLETVEVGEQVELCIEVEIHQTIDQLVLGYAIKDRLGQVIYGTNTWHMKQIINSPEVGSLYIFKIMFPANFGVGSYSVQVALTNSETHLTKNYEWKDLALIFNVINTKKSYFAGCLWSEPKILIEEFSQ